MLTDLQVTTAGVSDGLMGGIFPIEPDPRTLPVDQITVQFDQPVLGFDLNDVVVTRDGGSNLLTGDQSLTTDDNITWRLGNLSPVISLPGQYEAKITAADSGIRTAAGVPLVTDISRIWTDIRQAGDANGDGEVNTVDIILLLAAGKYETRQPATWGEGDYNGDGMVSTGDIIATLAGNNFEQGPYTADRPQRVLDAPAVDQVFQIRGPNHHPWQEELHREKWPRSSTNRHTLEPILDAIASDIIQHENGETAFT